MLLDASAVLALLFAEIGSDLVMDAMQQHDCLITAANQAEVIAKLVDRGLTRNDITTALSNLPITVIDSTPADGEAAGYLRSASRSLGLSLGDRLCLATAQRLNTPVMTADHVWLELAHSLNLNIIGVRTQKTS